MQWWTTYWSGRPLAKTPRTRISELVPRKIAKIVGRAHAVGEPIAAPFTGTPAATLRVSGARIERRARSVVSVPLDDVDFGHAFYVEDESGIALVERHGWSTLLVERARITNERQFGAGEHIERFFARYGQEHRTFFDGFQGAILYNEWTIPEGATIAVLGAVEPASAPIERGREGGYREAPQPMALVPPEHARLLVSASPKHAR